MSSLPEIDECSEIQSRLGSCEVCGNPVAKYTCPRCEVKTCCLSCIKIHKQELNCSGTRNKIKFKYLQEFSDFDLQSDYLLLEETARNIEQFYKQSKKLLHRRNLTLVKLQNGAARRGVKLMLLPENFSRRKSNTTYLDWSTDSLYWKIEWIFPEANNLHTIDPRILDSNTIRGELEKYVIKEKCDSKFQHELSTYHNHNPEKIVVLLKAEKMGKSKFFLLDCNSDFKQQLKGKLIIENPIIHVVLVDKISNYEVLIADEEDTSQEKNFFFN